MARLSRATRVAITALGYASLALADAPLRADVTKSQCVDANSNGQSLRIDGKLEAARHELQLCSDASCPAIVRNDCAQRMDDLERAQPTIVFDVKDANGGDLSAVKVTIDGHALTDKLDGTALRVDPGEHAFTFGVIGQPAIVRTFIVKEGEKRRRERIVFSGTPDAATGLVPIPPLPPALPTQAPDTAPAKSEAASASHRWGTQRVVGLTAGGLGVAGIAVGSVFGLLTFSAVSAQKAACPASGAACADRASAASDHSSGATDGAVSTVAFIAGGALIVAGVALFFTVPKATVGVFTVPKGTEGPRAAVFPMFGRDGAGLSLVGEL
jgi:hypothetical protein